MTHTPTIHIPPQLQAHTQPESSCCAQEERLDQVPQCLETIYSIQVLILAIRQVVHRSWNVLL